MKKFDRRTGNSKRERYERIYEALAPVREAKKNTIHSLAGVGRKYKILRYPLLVVLSVFLFLYNLFLYGLIGLKMEEKLARGVAVFMTVVLVFTSVDLTAFAVANGVEDMASVELLSEEDSATESAEASEGTGETSGASEESGAAKGTGAAEETEATGETGAAEGSGASEGSEAAEGSGAVEGTEAAEGSGASEGSEATGESGAAEETEATGESGATEETGAAEGSGASEGSGAAEGTEATEESGASEGTEATGESRAPEATAAPATPVPEAALEQSVVQNGIEISVYAPAGVFPAGAVLQVEMITGEAEVSEIEQLVTEKKDGYVEKSYSFDITIVDATGTEIEPDISKGQVFVTFKNVGIIEAEQQEEKELSVFYVSDDYSEAQEISHEADIQADSAVIAAEHFSIYTVVITSGEKKDTVLHYYQGATQAVSYFTIYNGEQLSRYRDLLDGYVNGSVKPEDTFAAILVNSDDSNPMDGITGVGQSANMTVKDLNFSVKVMDDISVEEWKPIETLPTGVSFDGAGHTIWFESLAAGVTFDGTDSSVLAKENQGTITDVTLKYGDKSFTVAGQTVSGLYATVTVRVDGQKAEIGQAITGAEALAASCDGVHFITLERSDDLSVYRTELENLYELNPDNAEPGDAQKVYSVYYVYEDENETISAATLTKENYAAELNYLSVSYDLEGANTYKLVDGKLSENVMAAIRVDVLEDGSYEAKEDYEAIVKAAAGYAIPTRDKNVVVKVGEKQLTLGTDYTYLYDAESELGTIHINRDKITAPVSIQVKADSLEDNPPNTVILKTRGGSVSDVLWEKSDNGVYEQRVYEDTALPSADTIIAYKGSDAIRFAGWYTTADCTGSPVTTHTYQAGSQETGGKTVIYYAKWVLNQTSSHNENVYYQYKGGRLEIQGYPNENNSGQVTYSDAGFRHAYQVGSLSDEQKNGDTGGTEISMAGSENQDIFVRIGNTDVYVAMICTLESSLVDITYLFENRGAEGTSDPIYFGAHADVQIAADDYAAIDTVNTAGGVSYITMTSGAGTTYPNKQFRLYSQGESFGIDKLYSYWYGYYGSRSNKVFTNENRVSTGVDSGLAFSWAVESIPAGEYVTKTTKMGLADVSVMNNVTAKLEAGEGRFRDGSSSKSVVSDAKSITVNADGSILVKKTTGNETIEVPARSGWKFSHWSLGAEGGADCSGGTGKEFTENVTLYANWIPKPDKSVKNNSSIQKVSGSNNLLVPEQLGNIVIYNTTPGATTAKILQGQTAEEAAGYASGFSCYLAVEGEDDRYLLPDDIEVTVTDRNGTVTKLTKDTGYTYNVYDNRKKADLEIRRQFINGDITVTAVGYELPPVTATSVKVSVARDSIAYGERAVFTASAETSKNHTASYQWYIAPYYEITLDNKLYWTYQNQNGIPLSNGTYVSEEWNESGNPITVSGANKATLRISGLDVNPFREGAEGESMSGLRFGGYHVYCVVTSTRNITGQEIVAVSEPAELEVTIAQYEAPVGLESSATTYRGSADGSVFLPAQTGTARLLYRKTTESAWKSVTEQQLQAGEITGLTAGTYEFCYQADTNHRESPVTEVTVAEGRDIIVTYRAALSDDASLRNQYRRVSYGSAVTADETIKEPVRAGYTFMGWEPEVIENITEDTVVNAVYTSSIYELTLDSRGAESTGSRAVYEKYSEGFYLDAACSSPVSSTAGIEVPRKAGYSFTGYYTAIEGGIRVISPEGYFLGNVSTTKYLEDSTLYAHWEEKKVQFEVVPDVTTPEGGEPAGDVELEVKPSNPEDAGEEYHPNISYDVTITNRTGKTADTIYIYSDGELKRTLTDVTFDENNQYTFTLIPEEIGGGNITFAVGNTTAESEEEQTERLAYDISYLDADGSSAGGAFSGFFTETAPAKGIKGLATVLPQVTKTGYTFGGWYDNGKGTGRAITEIPADNDKKSVTVYAKWIPNKYQITLIRNGGAYVDGYTPADQYQYGAGNVALPDGTQIVRDNYAFLGWFDNRELAGNAITEVDASQASGKTYYAGWELLSTHKITLPEDTEMPQRYTAAGLEGYGFTEENEIFVYDGMEYRFEVKTIPSYRLAAVKANGKLLSGTDGIYSIGAVTEDTVITVSVEKLLSTVPNDQAVATIELPDGTTGYFSSLEEAIEYAADYGTDSVIRLQQDLEDVEIDGIAGNAYTIDLNGHTVSGDSTLLIEDGAVVSLVDTVKELNPDVKLSVENRGEFTNSILVEELLNLGIAENHGKIASMTQQDSESYAKSKLVNYGEVGQAKLESGYFVEEVLESAPEGLTGYKAILNGREYYADFKDAADIANEAEEDVTIKLLDTVDNRNQEIHLKNEAGYEITVDFNGNNLYNGSLVTEGKVSLINSIGSATVISEITADLRNEGELSTGAYVKISSSVENNGSLKNDGNITGIVENNGNVDNRGSMNHVVQKEGNFKNSGDVKTTLDIQGGGYTPEPGAVPATLEGAVAKSNTQPPTYYNTLEDALKDAENPDITGAPGQELPFTITIMEDIPDEKLGKSNPVTINPTVPVDINMNNHKVGSEDSDKELLVDGGKVSFKNEPEDGEEGDSTSGTIQVPVEVKKGGSLEIGNNTSAGMVKNNGTLEVKPEGEVGKLTQTGGSTKNEGTIKEAELEKGGFTGNEPTGSGETEKAARIDIPGEEPLYFGNLEDALDYAAGMEQSPVTVEVLEDITDETIAVKPVKTPANSIILDLNGNEIKEPSSIYVEKGADLTLKGGTVSAPVTNEGNLTNQGEISGDVVQKDGTFTNESDAVTKKIIQDGGKIVNEGQIGTVEISGGEYEGKPADSTNRTGAKVEVTKKNPDGTTTTTYYPSVKDALDNTEGDATLKLLEDLKEDKAEDIVIDKPGIILDLNGHEIESPSSLTVSENAENTRIEDSSAEKSGAVKVPVQNKGELQIGEETRVDEVINTGALDNQGNLGKVDFQGGSYQGKNPEAPLEDEKTVAKIGDTIYADIDSAIKDANRATGDVTIELVKDVTLHEDSENPDVPGASVGNENGNKITLDLGGNTISGGTLEIKAPGTTEITDSGENRKGAVGSDVKVAEGAKLEIDSDTELKGNLKNEGTTENNGIINGKADNTGSLTNKGNIENDVTNRGNGKLDNQGNLNGQLENRENATAENTGNISQVKQSGGEVTNNAGGKVNDYLQNGGSFNNESGAVVDNLKQTDGKTNNEGKITEAEIDDLGNYTGKLPENDIPGTDVKVTYTDKNGQTRTEYYPSLEDALEAAEEKKQEGSSDITVIPEKTPVTVDKKLEVPEGVTVEVPENTELVIGENGELKNNGDIRVDGSGRLTVENGGKLENDGNIGVSKDGSLTVENGGSLNNSGTLKNDGTIANAGTLDNAGSLENSGKVENTGSLKNEAGAVMENTGAESRIDGLVENEGTLDNAGTMENVNNHGNGSFNNDGQVTGKLENRENAVTNNNGMIEEAEVEKVGNYLGELPKNDIPEAVISVIYQDENGQTRKEHYSSLEEALEAAKEKKQDGSSDITVIPEKTPVTVDKKLEVPEGVTVEVPENTELVIGENGELKNNGDIRVDGSGKLTVENGGSLDNAGNIGVSKDGGLTVGNGGKLDNAGNIGVSQDGSLTVGNGGSLNNAGNIGVSKDGSLTVGSGGKLDNAGTIGVSQDGSLTVGNGSTLDNKGSLKNEGTLVNDGTIENQGDISTNAPGTLTNQGTLKNEGGSLNGAPGADGTIANEGTISGGTVNGPLHNTETGKMTEIDKISGSIKNDGQISAGADADLSGAEIVNGSTGSLVKEEKPDTDGEKDDSGDEEDEGTAASGNGSTTVQKPGAQQVSGQQSGNRKPGSSQTGNSKPDASQTGNRKTEGQESESQKTGEQTATASVQEAMDAGRVELEGIASAEAEFVESVLTEEEKELLTNGASLKVVAKVVPVTKQEVPEKVLEEVQKYVAENSRVSALELQLFKQIGDNREERVAGELQLQISFALPEEQQEGEEYQILRLTTDEDGQVHAEAVAFELSDNEVTMYADTESTYVIVSKAVLSREMDSQNTDNAQTGQLNRNPQKDSSGYWGYIAAGILAILNIFLLILLFKRKKEEEK